MILFRRPFQEVSMISNVQTRRSALRGTQTDPQHKGGLMESFGFSKYAFSLEYMYLHRPYLERVKTLFVPDTKTMVLAIGLCFPFWSVSKEKAVHFWEKSFQLWFSLQPKFGVEAF